jgi:hypothetical protein
MSEIVCPDCPTPVCPDCPREDSDIWFWASCRCLTVARKFLDKEARDRWAVVHERATGHTPVLSYKWENR